MKSLLAVFAVAALLLSPAQAASPASGTVSPAMPKADFTAGPYLNATGVAGLFCDSASNCDSYTLTAELPADYTTTHPGAFIRIGLAWQGRAELFSFTLNDLDTGAAAEGVTSSTDLGFQTLYLPAGAGTRHLQLVIAPPSPTNSVIQGVVQLVDGSGEGLRPNPVGPGVPRFQIYTPPADLDGNQGEPSVGYSPDSKLGFILSGLRTLWLQFPQDQTPALPKACNGTWEDRSAPLTNVTSLDPIAVADSLVRGHHTSRVWVGQLIGVNSSMSFSDDGGETWTPNQGGPPLAATDHQTIAAGPYPSSLAPLFPTPIFPNAFYYCGQDIGFASCARSDNGGLTFNEPVPMYAINDCAGIHGHVRVAPDGTVSVPSKACGTNVAVNVSEDAGSTWAIRKVPGSIPSIRDPSMAWATDNTGYFCYSNGPGRARVAVTKDKGRNWETPVEMGEDMGIKHVMFTHMIAGDPDRATCAYVGTTTEGNPVAADFPGLWHVYFSTTYDGGKTWVTVNATPNDTVQGVGGIWNSGGSNTNRNLLDFNEISIDEHGYPLYGYADGCTGGCDQDPTQNPYDNFPKIVRQIAGKPLYAEFDGAAEPRAPADACLAGTRTPERTQLTWVAPENGGAAISRYNVYRSTDPNVVASSATLVGSTDGTPAFIDATADVNIPTYYYRVTALNSAGEGIGSNEVLLPLGDPPVPENICLVPGATLLEDPVGDLITPTGQASVTQLDIRKLSISQPFFENGDDLLYVHLRMQSMAAPLPVATWPISFCGPAFACTNPATAYGADNKFYTLQMVTDSSVVASASPATPVFRLLKPTADGITTASRAVTTLSGNGSGYVGSGVDNGLITFVVPPAELGLARGATAEKLRAFLTRIAVPPGVTPDNMPNELAGAGEYTLAAPGFCAPNTEPVARLVATPTSGTAPLDVRFDATGSSDAEDTVVEFRLDFGDGSGTQVQSTPTFSHRYTGEGFYNAQLTVKDARGLVSSSPAQAMISVAKASTPPPPDTPGTPPIGQPTPTPVPPTSDGGRFGGSPGVWLLIGLAVLGCRRRRPV